jgi:hypothetical protein
MKVVVFASVHDAARSKMAAAFFNAFTLPALVRAVSGGDRPLLWVVPDVVQAWARSASTSPTGLAV